MGDMLTLIEKAQRTFDQEEMQRQQDRLNKGEFTLDDFRNQMNQARRLGSFGKLLSLIPGMGQVTKLLGSMNLDADAEMDKFGGIIDSMTPEERRNPRIIEVSRRNRIAQGAGVQPHQVNELIKSFLPMQEMMKSMSTMSIAERMRTMNNLTKNLQNNPLSGNFTLPKKGTGKRLTTAEKAKAKKQREKELKKKKKK